MSALGSSGGSTRVLTPAAGLPSGRPPQPWAATQAKKLFDSVPHLHAHLIPRYAHDPRPEWPFPFPEDDPEPLPEAELRADAARLCEVAQALAVGS